MQVGNRFKPPSRRKSVFEKKLEPCKHSRPIHLYQTPCYQCGKFCNCDLKKKYPDVLVCSLDRIPVRLNSIVVRGSTHLQSMVRKALKKAEAEQQKQLDREGFVVLEEMNDSGIDISDDIECIQIDDSSDDDCENEEKTTGLFECNSTVLDLREGKNKDVPTVGVTAKMLRKIQKYMSLHLQQVDMAVEKEYREKSFFANSLFRRPPKDPVNPFGFEDWEEAFFDVNPSTMIELIQASRVLHIWDLFLATEKWIQLFRGRPSVEKFGKGLYLKGKGSKENVDSGCEDFVNKAVHNPRKNSCHQQKQAFYTKTLGHTFPRRLRKGFRFC